MGIKLTKEGRTILSGRDYTEHKRGVYERQGGKCADCGFGFPYNRMEFHHFGGRGLGGSKRDDLSPLNRMLCGGPQGCHEKARFEHLKPKAEFNKKVTYIVEWAENEATPSQGK
jgi:hypothetical protein